jgi:signal transduction histidine kinase
LAPSAGAAIVVDMPTSPFAATTSWLSGLSRQRIVTAIVLGIAVGLMLNPIFITPLFELMARTVVLSMLLMLAYTLAGNWRQQVVPVWVVQLVAVCLTAPLGTFAVYMASAGGDISAFLGNEYRIAGFTWIAGSAIGVGVLFALGAMVREREALAQAQRLQFELERSTLERQALDAQLRMLRAQIEPHFLFNTLANVQALVESGSPRAAPVLSSLIAYLRAAMPKLRADDGTLGDELQLVRAYLELMHLRMPDRLEAAIAIEPRLERLRFPSMALLTVVENAVRHGIDPSERGGCIEVGAREEGGRLRVWVADSGVGLDPGTSPGTGLANLRQRLTAMYGAAGRLELSEAPGGGVRAEIAMPAEGGE